MIRFELRRGCVQAASSSQRSVDVRAARGTLDACSAVETGKLVTPAAVWTRADGEATVNVRRRPRLAPCSDDVEPAAQPHTTKTTGSESTVQLGTDPRSARVQVLIC